MCVLIYIYVCVLMALIQRNITWAVTDTYRPKKGDEVELKEECDDGWAYGTVNGSSEQMEGGLPRGYVRLTSRSEISSRAHRTNDFGSGKSGADDASIPRLIKSGTRCVFTGF